MNRSSIRHSIILYVCSTVMRGAIGVAFLSLAFLFSVEDEFIEREIGHSRATSFAYPYGTHGPPDGYLRRCIRRRFAVARVESIGNCRRTDFAKRLVVSRRARAWARGGGDGVAQALRGGRAVDGPGTAPR